MFFNPLKINNSVAYKMAQSLRFVSGNSAYLSKTFGSTTSTTKFSYGVWVKRNTTGAAQALISYNAIDLIQFNASDQLDIQFNATVGGQITTTSLFRDPTAWMFILVAIDTTQSTASNRVRVYVNGIEITVFSTASYPTLNYTMLGFNNALAASIGRTGIVSYFDGYMTQAVGVDGTQCTPAMFGATNGGTLAWNPKAPSGFSYGTNGWLMTFSDMSATTSSAMGKDTSGAGNNWTPNNFSITAGAANDGLTDTPTNYGTDSGIGGEVRGNYCTLSPAPFYPSTVTRGGLTVSTANSGNPSNAYGNFPLNVGVDTNTYSWEFTATTAGGQMLGIVLTGSNNNDYSHDLAGFYGYYGITGNKYNNAVATGYGATWGNTDVITVKLNCSTGDLTFYKNNSSQGVAYTVAAGIYVAVHDSDSTAGRGGDFNFGQRAYTYSAPGKALCTNTLVAGTIITTGTFIGTVNVDGPFVNLNGVPTAMTINSNAVTFGTNVDALADGFKVRSSSVSYNATGSNTYSVSTTAEKFKFARARSNP